MRRSRRATGPGRRGRVWIFLLVVLRHNGRSQAGDVDVLGLATGGLDPERIRLAADNAVRAEIRGSERWLNAAASDKDVRCVAEFLWDENPRTPVS